MIVRGGGKEFLKGGHGAASIPRGKTHMHGMYGTAGRELKSTLQTGSSTGCDYCPPQSFMMCMLGCVGLRCLMPARSS